VPRVLPGRRVVGGDSRAVPAVLLTSFGGYHCWRFNLTAVLTAQPQAAQYSIRYSSQLWPKKKYVFQLPATDSWRWGLHASSGQPQAHEEGHMWADVLAQHRTTPLHVLVGAGGQIDGSGVWHLPLLKQWLALGQQARLAAAFSADIEGEVSGFYFRQYCTQLAAPDAAYVLATVPQVSRATRGVPHPRNLACLQWTCHTVIAL